MDYIIQRNLLPGIDRVPAWLVCSCIAPVRYPPLLGKSSPDKPRCSGVGKNLACSRTHSCTPNRMPAKISSDRHWTRPCATKIAALSAFRAPHGHFLHGPKIFSRLGQSVLFARLLERATPSHPNHGGKSIDRISVAEVSSRPGLLEGQVESVRPRSLPLGTPQVAEDT